MSCPKRRWSGHTSEIRQNSVNKWRHMSDTRIGIKFWQNDFLIISNSFSHENDFVKIKLRWSNVTNAEKTRHSINKHLSKIFLLLFKINSTITTIWKNEVKIIADISHAWKKIAIFLFYKLNCQRFLHKLELGHLKTPRRGHLKTFTKVQSLKWLSFLSTYWKLLGVKTKSEEEVISFRYL